TILSCRDAATGRVCWSRPLPTAPQWVGRRGGMILVGGTASVNALRLEDGSPRWTLTEEDVGDDEAAGPFGAFRLAGPRLFFMQDGRRLYAVGADTGCVHWARWAPAARLRPAGIGGRFHPNYHAGEDRLLVQT